jgi:hypothetical protein
MGFVLDTRRQNEWEKTGTPWDRSDAMDVKYSSSGMVCGVRVATISLGQGHA